MQLRQTWQSAEPASLLVLQHPKLGASWEGFLIEQILARVDTNEVYFWATHQGAEIDLVIKHARLFVGIEIKLI